MNRQTTDVMVVGAGPCGLAASLASEVDTEPFEVVEHVLLAQDERSRHVAALRQRCGEQSMHEPVLGRAHLRQRQATVIGRRVEPEPSLLGWKRPQRGVELPG